MELTLILLESKLAVCQLPAEAPIPEWAFAGEFSAIVKTPDELSIVCEQRLVPTQIRVENGWRAFKVQGPLDFSQVGVLAGIARPLAQAGVSIFVISTFDTDYLLVKEVFLDQSVRVLRQNGFTMIVQSVS